MTPEEYEKATELFALASELPEADREAWVTGACQNCPALKQTVMAMLGCDQGFDSVEDRGFGFVPPIEIDATLASQSSADRQVDPAESPKTLGKYELLREVGRGSMGVVFQARQKQPDRLVALKTIRAGRLASEADVKRFVNESQAAAKLNHDGIVPVYEVGCENGVHYFSMQFIEGQSLEELTSGRKRNRRQMIELLAEVCEAVSHCHEHGIIHRDLKPSNILIDAKGKPKVSDFGLARNLHYDSTLTATGDVMGTPGYMPPEQAVESSTVANPTADVYSLGAILYRILTGRPPILARDVNLAGAIQLIRDHDVVAAKFFDRKIDRDLDTICSKCLEKEPGKRYVHAGELAADLRAYLDDEPIQARGLGVYRRVLRWARQQPGLAVSWAAILMIFSWHLSHFYILSVGQLTMNLHVNAILVAGCWALGAWGFQRALMLYGGRSLILFTWATMDVILLSLLLCVREIGGASSYITFLYFPIVAVASLRMRIDLLIYTTGLSLTAYWIHVVRNSMEETLVAVPAANAVMFSLSLLTLGLVQYFSLRRSRFAIESFAKRPQF